METMEAWSSSISTPVQLWRFAGAYTGSSLDRRRWRHSSPTGEDNKYAAGFTEGDSSALPARAREMESGVDIVVAVGPLETDAAREAAPNHPVVFLDVGDPVGQGLIETFASRSALIVTGRNFFRSPRSHELSLQISSIRSPDLGPEIKPEKSSAWENRGQERTLSRCPR